MSSLPLNLHTVKHYNEYFGFRYNTQSIVFGFKSQRHAHKIHNQIKKSKYMPVMNLDGEKNVVIHKSSARKVNHKISVQNVFIETIETEELIMNNGINGVSTCIVSKVADLEQFIVFTEYTIVNIEDPPTDCLSLNLEELYNL